MVWVVQALRGTFLVLQRVRSFFFLLHTILANASHNT